ncbi:MAG: UDP-N-acetylglucosamine 2-epimerase, partial [Bacteroidia bacterium]|nr:UDP-N-acetylglucosamine 2-epimerase [Bacteroidia bacterium]
MNCIVVVFGTRPEFIKLFSVIEQLKRIKDTDVIIINANQQPDLLEPLLKHFKFEADYTLKGVNGSDLLESSQKITNQLNEIIKSIRLRKEIDFILAQGDTNTVLAASTAGRYNGIKFSHIEAGLRSFSDNDPYPEEMNRKLDGAGGLH